MIPLREVMDEARAALLAQPLRTGLAAAGIVVGIATVIAALAVGEGARRAAMADIATLGIDNVYVRAVPAAGRGGRPAAPLLTRADADAIGGGVGEVAGVAVARMARAELTVTPDLKVRGSEMRPAVQATVVGVSPSWSAVTRVAVREGRWLATLDELEAARVGVAGAVLAGQLGLDAKAAGTVAVNGQTVSVVGTLQPSERASSGAAIQLFDA